MCAKRFRHLALSIVAVVLVFGSCEFWGIDVESTARPLEYRVEAELTVAPAAAGFVWVLPPSVAQSSAAASLNAGDVVWAEGTAESGEAESVRFEFTVPGPLTAGDEFVWQLRYTNRQAEPPQTHYVRCFVIVEGDTALTAAQLAERCGSPRDGIYHNWAGDNTGGSTVTYELPVPYLPPHSRN